MPFEPEFWSEILTGIATGILEWLPSLAGALLLLLLGWFVARLVRFILAGLLQRIGLDKLANRAGISQILSNAGVEALTTNLLASLVYWLILLVFVIAAVESLGLTGVVDTLGGLVDYIPNVLAASLILLLGGAIARIFGEAVGAISTQAGMGASPVLGQAVRYVLLVFVVILALEQLGIQTTLLTTAATSLIAAVALALALAFGFGSRDLARNIMAGYHAKDSFDIGQKIRINGRDGKLRLIGSVKSEIETENGILSIPNHMLTDEEVTIYLQSEDE